MLLSKFSNEVLSKGPEAVLPQNLSLEWLVRIQKMADDFLDSHFHGGTCESDGFKVDPILSACVSELLQDINDGNIDIREDDMFKYVTLYALAVTMETVRREQDIGLSPPTVASIFDPDRLQELKRLKPDIAPVLTALCLNPKTKSAP
jgi:hypothetical protein